MKKESSATHLGPGAHRLTAYVAVAPRRSRTPARLAHAMHHLISPTPTTPYYAPGQLTPACAPCPGPTPTQFSVTPGVQNPDTSDPRPHPSAKPASIYPYGDTDMAGPPGVGPTCHGNIWSRSREGTVTHSVCYASRVGSGVVVVVLVWLASTRSRVVHGHGHHLPLAFFPPPTNGQLSARSPLIRHC